MIESKTLTDAAERAHIRALSAARHAKRQAQWLAALAEEGWTESAFVTAVIRKRVQLPAKDSQNG